ncbi:MAG: ABC transporter ATP-binding protein [Clostridia bacterium]
MNDSAPALSVSGLVQRFGRTMALDGLTFSVMPNQVVGLLGRNGAGKSTLLRIVSGQLRQSEGTAELFGLPVFNRAAALGELCMIGDTPDFGKLKNIGELFFVCEGLFPHWNKPYAARLVERFELPMAKKLKGFSRGMQTALLLSVGLASGATLTVFDEPSLGLDAVMRERFYDLLLEERHSQSGRTFLLSTHLIDEVARTLDSAVLIDAGKLLCEGSLAELTSLYLSVSGAPDAVRAITDRFVTLKEEEVAGSLVRHLRLNEAADAARLRADASVQCAPMNLQRLFVFLTEEKGAARDAATA